MVNCYNEVWVAKNKRFAFVEAIDDGTCLTLNWVISRLSCTAEAAATEDCLPTGRATSREGGPLALTSFLA